MEKFSKVKEVIALGEGPGAGNLVIAEIIKIHIAENILDAEGKIDPLKIYSNLFLSTTQKQLIYNLNMMVRRGDKIRGDIHRHG